MDVSKQLEIFGLEETRRRSAVGTVTLRGRARALQLINTSHEILSTLPDTEDLHFLHSGLCQTSLPHSRPALNHTVWRRTSGRFTLAITPGVITRPNHPKDGDGYVGVPYGAKARLILIHLQTEGLRSRTVHLGDSLSAFMRSLGLAVTGGAKGSLALTKEQVLRIANCSFALQWSQTDDNGTHTQIRNHRIIDGLEIWEPNQGENWSGTVQLSERFHSELLEHSVPLDKRAIVALRSNSLGLDLYTLFAYRLPRLKDSLHLRWKALQSQVGSEESEMKELARRVRGVLPEVLAVYPQAKVELTPTGLTLRPSDMAVPSKLVRGFRVIEG